MIATVIIRQSNVVQRLILTSPALQGSLTRGSTVAALGSSRMATVSTHLETATWQPVRHANITPDESVPVFRPSRLDAMPFHRALYMVRPLIFSSHLDEGRVEAAVKTLVNACPYLAGRVQRDTATGEVVVVGDCSAKDRASDQAKQQEQLGGEISFGVPLTCGTWDCSLSDVIPGALVPRGLGTFKGVELLANPLPFVDATDCGAAMEGKEPLMKVRYTALHDGSILCVSLSHIIADGVRFSNLMCALAAAYRDEPLPPMLHDRSAIQPANLARAAREVLGLEVPLEEQGVTSSSGSAVTGPADSNVQPGPSAPEAQPAAAAPPPPPPQLPVMEPSECAFAAIHIPLREINTLKAEAAAFAEAHGLDAVALSANDVVTGLFAVARATLSGQPLPGTKLSQAKGSGTYTVLPIKTGPPSAADLLKPPEPGPWRLQMTADMVHNGFPLVDALGLKSYLGNLYDYAPVDSRDCPWVPELDALDPSTIWRDVPSADGACSGDSSSNTLLQDTCTTDEPTSTSSTSAPQAQPTKHISTQPSSSSVASGDSVEPTIDAVAQLAVLPGAGDDSDKAPVHKSGHGSTGGMPEQAKQSGELRNATAVSSTGALLRQSLLSGAFGVRAAVQRLRARFASPRCLEWLLVIGAHGHKEMVELGPVFAYLRQGLPTNALGLATNVSRYEDQPTCDWGEAKLVMAPWGWSATPAPNMMAVSQGPRTGSDQQPDGLVLHVVVKVGEEAERLRQVVAEVCPGAVWWGP